MRTTYCLALAALTLSLSLTADSLPAEQRQSRPPISVPSEVAPPTWWRTIPMPDGRKFVTDGGLSIDAAIVKPASLPEQMPPESSAAIVRHLAAPHDRESPLSDLSTGVRPNTFTTPSGVVINGNYITLLRSTSVARQIRLRTKGKTDPIVIVVAGQPVGVMMPVQPPREG